MEPPTGDAAAELANLLGQRKKEVYDFRTYRSEKTYSVSSGKWYFEVEILSDGPIRVGWASVNFSPFYELGGDQNDHLSWAYDCYVGRKYSGGNSEIYGKQSAIGDVIGCMLDLHDKTISFSLNGELMLDSVGGESAFTDIPTGESATYVPALTLGLGQKVKCIFGQDINALKYFTLCGLQEGYQPFCVNMNRNMTFWYNKDEPIFVDVDDGSSIEVIRIPPGSDSPPALKISHKLFETQEKASWEFVQLSLPVAIDEELIDEMEKASRWDEVRRRVRRAKAERLQTEFNHPAKLEQHMLQSGFSISDVKDLQRTYSDGEGEDGAETPSPTPMHMHHTSPWLKRSGSFTKTKSFDNELKVPTMHQAQQLMAQQLGTSKRSSSVEAINRSASSTTTGSSVDEERKRRSRSPFKFFTSSKKDEAKQKQRNKSGGRAPETGLDYLGFITPAISIHNASFRLSGSQLIPPTVPARRGSM